MIYYNIKSTPFINRVPEKHKFDKNFGKYGIHKSNLIKILIAFDILLNYKIYRQTANYKHH